MAEEKTNKNASTKMIGRCFEPDSMVAHPSSQPDKPTKNIEVHYYIEILDNGLMALERVGEGSLPTGELIDNLTQDEFKLRYKTCSQHECPLRISTLKEIEIKMAENRAKLGEDHLEKGELTEAKDKFKRALKFDENSVRAKFGLGKSLLGSGMFGEAIKTFEDLSQTKSLFEKENKHVFNKFGIELRNLKMYDVAIANYEKAILIDSTDEALYYNLSIVYEKKGFILKSIENLKEALELKEDFPEAQKRLSALLVLEQKSLENILKK